MYVDDIDYRHLVTQKTAIGMLIDLATNVIAVKMIMVESFIVRTVDIDWDDIHKKITLMR